MTKTTPTEKPSEAAAKPAAAKQAAKPAAKSSRATSKARTSAKKTTATRTATKKAASTKAATAPKKASPKPKNEKSVTSKAVAKATKTKVETSAEDDKPKIAPAPLRPALRVQRRAEANRDKNQTFKVKTKIVYPAHGVGYITEIEKQEIAGHAIELFVIDFEHEKMKLRVPVAKAAASGMRNLASAEQIDEMMKLIEGKARVKRTMWSRRAQEYEAKINSGDLTAVSEVVRDLFRADDQPEQSYSERQLFEQARERLGREVAAVRRKSLESAIKEIHTHLDKKEKAAAAAS
ncbi:CarD family transcriptional regulator [Parvularcula dongshanensis]|uniref:CarD family transcriptional regulator n=1 Tax=Parvularcula dongshanensis TaxID=1173995 RepID=A0A840I0U2_9PROT|nr:CarD family transcriptional regulator [Parvularcula dongshanensis]